MPCFGALALARGFGAGIAVLICASGLFLSPLPGIVVGQRRLGGEEQPRYQQRKEDFSRAAEDSPGLHCRAVWEEGLKQWQSRFLNRPGLSGVKLDPPPKSKAMEGVKFIHVGKAGGTSLQVFFAQNGFRIPEIHVNPVTAAALLHDSTIVTVLRDPVSRIVSAFNFQITEDPTNPHPLWRREWDECFPDVNTFAEGLDEQSRCGELARMAVGSTLPSEWTGSHMFMGPCYYMGGVLDDLRSKAVYAVRSDNWDEDINAFMKAIGHPITSHEHPQERGSQKDISELNLSNLSTELSPKGRDKLRRHLYFEYWLMSELDGILRKPEGVRRQRSGGEE